ncbi:MAG TPA: ABC transporter permease, partial [Candidatus Angelobacter sp.]
MKLLASLRSLAATLFRRSNVEAEMEEELRSHIQQRADDLERSGVPRKEAERQARIEFGGYERSKEECRRAVGAHLLETLLQDVRYGLRLLRKSRGFTAVAILTLALGIGANTAIFSLMNAVMLRSLPVQNPQELVQLLRFNPEGRGQPTSSFTNPLWEQVRDHQDLFSSVFSWSADQFDLAQGGLVHPVNVIFASGNYFNTLGVPPAAGRLFTTADDQRGCPATAVLSYGFWQEHFGATRSAVDSTLSLDNHSFQVIGVSSPGFNGVEVGRKFDVAIPVCTAAVFDGKQSRLDIRAWWWLNIIGRVKPGISPEQLKARLNVLSPQMFAAAAPTKWSPADQQRFARTLLVNVPAVSGISDVRIQFGQPLKILMAVVGLVLLIASANLASLMLARATSRNKEIAVRKALGASRSRLIRQLLTECVLLSSAGALLGIFFARWGAALLVRYISTRKDGVFLDLSPDVRILAFTAGIAVFTGLLFGVLPAFRSTRVSLTAAMKSGPAGETAQRKLIRPGKWIVASQVAFSLVLVMVAGLFLRSLVKLTTLDIGFDRSNVLIVNANLKTSGVPPEQRLSVGDEIESRLRVLPGMVSVGRSVRTPVSNWEWNQYVEVDTPNPPKGDDALAYFNFISPGYFQTLRTPLLAGRDFHETDTKTSPPVVIVNEAFARKLLSNSNPVGKYLRTLDNQGKLGAPIQIVGLVKDSKYESLREDTYSQAFFPMSQLWQSMDEENLELRTASRPSDLILPVQNAIAQVNKGISLDFHSLAEQVNDSIVQERLLATLSAFFGALALLLAMIGLYGSLSYLVNQRRSEFGVRMALGAPPVSILGLIMREVVLIVFSGALAGTILSLLSIRTVERLLFGLSAYDPTTMLGAIVTLAAVAL